MCRWCVRSQIVDRLTSGLSPTRRQLMAYAGAVTLTAGTGGRARASTAADTVFRNGPIHPMAPGSNRAEALAVGGGKILAVGSAAEVTPFVSPSTRIVDLEGRSVLPGLIDPHNHTVLSSLFDLLLINVGFSNFRTKAQSRAAMKAAVDRTPPGQWLAFGFYDNLLQGGDWSMAELDSLSTTHPILLLYVSGHVGAANALAFQRTKIPENVGALPGGGSFGRGSDGRLNGMIYNEPALLPFLDIAVRKPSPNEMASAIERYAQQAAAAGLTTLHEPGTVKPEWIELLAKLSNSLPIRMSASFSTDMIEAGTAFVSLGPSSRARRIPGSRLSLYGMKFWSDGSNQAETAAQTKPYLDSTKRGDPGYTRSEMTELCRKARDAGWTIMAHSQGDAAIDEYLDAMESAYGAHPASGLNRVEHATMARQDQIDRMKTLGCEPTFMADFVYLYGAAFRDKIFGPERAAFMVPFGAAAKAGIGFSLHSDNPAAGMPLNPLRLVQTAVTRRCVMDNSVIGPSLVLTVDQALSAVTRHAARHLGLDDAIGTLEPGKEADLTILDSDPYQTDPEKLMTIKVSETWVAGERKYGQ